MRSMNITLRRTPLLSTLRKLVDCVYVNVYDERHERVADRDKA